MGTADLQEWFPGDHGSVGGGGDITGLSDDALLWIAEGAECQRLQVNHRFLERLGVKPDYRAALTNESNPKRGIMSFLMSMKHVNRTGPSHLADVSLSARRRWKTNATEVPEGRAYRPATLEVVSSELETWVDDAEVEIRMAAE